jgi:hypothetical protein
MQRACYSLCLQCNNSVLNEQIEIKFCIWVLRNVYGKSLNFIEVSNKSQKSAVFWDITPCSLLKVNRRFVGTYRLHLQGSRTSLSRNQRDNGWQAQFSHWFFGPLKWRRYVPAKCLLNFNGLHGVISLHNHRCGNLKQYITFYTSTNISLF